MATALFGTIITGMRGSIGGNTFSQANGLAVVKRKGRGPLDPRVNQVPTRDAMMRLASNWRNLSAAQQLGWRNYALGVTFVNSLGQNYKIGGMQMYVRNSIFLSTRGPVIAATVPNLGGLPVIPTLTFIRSGTQIVLTNVVGMGGGAAEIRGTVQRAVPASAPLRIGPAFANWRYISGGAVPQVVSDGSFNQFAAGTEVVELIVWRYMDANFRVSSEVGQTLTFTV